MARGVGARICEAGEVERDGDFGVEVFTKISRQFHGTVLYEYDKGRR